jgi:hypothetical protein
MKIVTAKYFIDNIIFNSFFKIFGLPYYIYKLKKISYETSEIPSAKWYDIVVGGLDQLDILLTYVAFSGLSIGAYVTFRTLSLFFVGVLSMSWYKKLLSMEKLFSIGMILIASGVILGKTSKLSMVYSLMCIISAMAYSLISFIIEIFVKTDLDKKLNFYWSKIISCTISLFIGLTAEYANNTISKILGNFTVSNQILIIGLELAITLLENLYYYYKIKVISQYKTNGSIVGQFLDIMRRFTLIICGITFFSESYDKIFLIPFTCMFVGSLIGMFDFKKFIELKNRKNIPLQLQEIRIIEEDSISQDIEITKK